ncbi:basic-leucine zipper transcription factor A isoform X3 [Drosophila nasuta]|uniref:basic-leucine zipper transcription factor A isoform X3 n=1 Tax=Drosophila nasuta TaxID=42062 RepID=UPI00295EB991|nr:basic-leucine zipper transcription factor A isoform X3 [Drosophila nasuta]
MLSTFVSSWLLAWLDYKCHTSSSSNHNCYETSGLFLGDSTDGLAALPALHHEPPPSYDAVVLHERQLLQQQQQQLEEQQLQLQQQQLLLQRVSPPPGYRSTLDISCLQQASSSAAAVAGGSVEAMPGGSGNSPATGVGAVGGDALVHKQLHRTLNAQSCCSLQRAEVENMWNAAAAAVAARNNGNCQELEMYMASPSPPLPLALQARKNAQAALRLNSFGRRYLQQSQLHMQQHSHYRRGCPLCGKFRYAADDEMLAASVESGLEQCDDNDNVASEARIEQQQQQQQQQQMTLTCLNGNQIDAAVVEADAANGNVVDNSTTAAEDVEANADIDENDNAAETPTATATATAASSSAAATTATTATADEAAANLDINNINENGIISLDMSKIIDVSGLPTYEGALKLESSGYV